MMTRNTHIPASQWAVAVLFAVLSLVTLYLFVRVAEPPEREPGIKFTQNYEEDALTQALTAQGLRRRFADIQRSSTSAGARQIGRVAGTPGFENTAKLIETTFADACGQNNVVSQRFPVVVPVTEYCEILGQDGKPLPGVALYPFEPAGLVPTALPDEGVTGPLVITKSKAPLDLVEKPLEQSIVLNEGLDLSWAMLASMGAQAVLVKEDAIKQGDPDTPATWNVMTTPFDQPFPRFLVRGPIEQFAGQPLTIRCKVTWQSRPARNIIGVLRGQAPDKVNEALVVTCYYDSYSVVPDVSPGGEQAISLAVMLEMARALKSYQSSMKRDIVFVATSGHAQSLEGVCRLNQAIESFTTRFKDYTPFEKLITEHQTKVEYVQTALNEIIGSEEPWNPTDGLHPVDHEKNKGNIAYRQQWERRNPAFREWFEDCFATVTGEVNLERRAEFLQARLDWIRAGQPNFREGFNAATATSVERQDRKNRDPLMNAYLDAKAEDNTSGNMITTPFWMTAYNLRPTKKDARDRFNEWGYIQKTEAYLKRLQAYHEQQIAELEDSIVVRDLFKPYAKTLTVNLELYSGGAQQKRDLAVLMGRKIPGTVVEPQSTDLRNAIDEKIPATGATKPFTVTSWGSKDAEGGTNDPNIHSQWNTELESEVWFRSARQAFTVINKAFLPGKIGTPEDTFDGLVLDGVIAQMTPISKALLAIAHGKVGFKTIQYIPGNDAIVTFRGSVLTSAGVTAAVPNHRVGERTFVRYYQNTGPLALSRGIRLSPIIQANPYGDYYRKFNFDLSMWGNPVTVDAARFDNRGYITYYKDASLKSQSIFKNEIFPSSDLAIGSEKPINVQLFRAAQVVCYQRGNPKTLTSFAGFNFIQKLGMQAPERMHPEISPSAPGISVFLDPDCVFYIAMLDGSAANPEVQTFRAFMMNNLAELDDDALRASYLTPGVPTLNPPNADDGELAGKGYLAAGWAPTAMPYTSLDFPYFDAAASMIRTNGMRLAKENQYFMADKQMLESHDLAKEKLREALEFKEQGDAVNATNAAGRALSYTINNHPVIRTKISNAIIGILWYLMILVPFVFFFEKLVFGNTDIRKQLLAYGIIFIAVFALLWYFHPAFQMVNQPLIILLGFLIFLLAMIVSLMVAGKFQQTIKVLRSKEGNVEGADVNRAGVIGTAFMLGLNNMRRRKVRTGLTSVTLVLITFVMICFTSVDTSENEKQIPTGKSPSNGLMRRDPNFVPITEGEINNLTQLFGLDYPISVNYWLVGAINVTAFKNAEIFIDREQEISGQVKKSQAKVNASISMPWNEPEFTGIDQYLMKPNRGWFPRPPQTEKEIADAAGTPMPDYVILPDTVATALELTPEKVHAEHPIVNIRGAQFEVRGIIDSQRLTAHRGMDGQSILPYDLNTITQLGRSSKGDFIVPSNIGRMHGSQIIITSKPLPPKDSSEQNFAVSCSVLFPDENYLLRSDMPEKAKVSIPEQRRVITEYLDRVGQGAYYAIDGYSYYGYRMRAKTTSGLMFMLIPILIAALTVFNTMRSSVYERKDEIYVYNAVGIAPNHIFFMFMAEASVYAVMGAMLGYLLSQITGKVLTALHLTSGLNMDYSSIETIVASLVIVVSVLLSTLVPAYTASRLALPSDEASWTVPKADGDVMTFNLPFTFGPMDRLAVISYFYRWLDANGEGSSGSFYCAPPEPRIAYIAGEPNSDGLVPQIESTVWLKPFDLGVSQRLEISLPTDPETGEFIARITIERLSGTVAAWNRAVMPFLTALRKQFLNWRAVSDAERTEMFEEARTLFMKPYDQERANG